jgi:hypothetical protein
MVSRIHGVKRRGAYTSKLAYNVTLLGRRGSGGVVGIDSVAFEVSGNNFEAWMGWVKATDELIVAFQCIALGATFASGKMAGAYGGPSDMALSSTGTVG